MRKNYVKPALISEEFVPQTYVAACADEPGYTVYKFECTAGEEDKSYDVYVGGTDITSFLTYSPCGGTHEVKVKEGTPVEDVFEIGYMDDVSTTEKEEYDVYVWRGNYGINTHCMVNPGTEHIAVPKQMS